MEKNILGKRIELERMKLGLNQMQLAEKLNLSSSSSISQYESGDRIPSDDIKLMMCKIFNCSLDYLLGNSDVKNVALANSNQLSHTLNTEGLDEDDLMELQKQIDYIKRLKKKQN